jgi:hypothetical protein
MGEPYFCPWPEVCVGKEAIESWCSKSRGAVKSNPRGDNMSKPKTKNPIWQFLCEILGDRDLATNTIGACLLIAMFLFVVVAVFLGMMKPDIIANAFTLILGYFFRHIAPAQEVPVHFSDSANDGPRQLGAPLNQGSCKHCKKTDERSK